MNNEKKHVAISPSLFLFFDFLSFSSLRKQNILRIYLARSTSRFFRFSVGSERSAILDLAAKWMDQMKSRWMDLEFHFLFFLFLNSLPRDFSFFKSFKIRVPPLSSSRVNVFHAALHTTPHRYWPLRPWFDWSFDEILVIRSATNCFPKISFWFIHSFFFLNQTFLFREVIDHFLEFIELVTHLVFFLSICLVSRASKN